MSIEIRNVNYKINRDVQHEDKNLGIITIKWKLKLWGGLIFLSCLTTQPELTTTERIFMNNKNGVLYKIRESQTEILYRKLKT